MPDLNENIEEAVARLKKARDKIDKENDKSTAKEPKTILSGEFDELSIRRRRKAVEDE